MVRNRRIHCKKQNFAGLLLGRQVFYVCSTHSKQIPWMKTTGTLYIEASNSSQRAYATQQRHYMAAIIAMQLLKVKLLLQFAAGERTIVSYYIKIRSTHYFLDTWPQLDTKKFKKAFRFDRSGFAMLVNSVERLMMKIPPPGLSNLPNRFLPPYQRVAIDLN